MIQNLLASEIPLGDSFSGFGVFGSNIGGLNSECTIGSRFATLVSTMLGFLTILAGLAFLLYFLLGAIQWITSNGDPQKVESAKNQMTAAGIGLVAAISAYVVAGIVSIVLGIDILDPSKLLLQITGSGGGC